MSIFLAYLQTIFNPNTMRQTSSNGGECCFRSWEAYVSSLRPTVITEYTPLAPCVWRSFSVLKYLPFGKLTILEVLSFHLNFSSVLTFILQPFHPSVCCPFCLPRFPCLHTLCTEVIILSLPFYFSMSASHFPPSLNFYWFCSPFVTYISTTPMHFCPFITTQEQSKTH